MPCGLSADTGTRVTTNRTQWPPSGSTTRTCPSRSRSTSRVGSRGAATQYCYHTEATPATECKWRRIRPSAHHCLLHARAVGSPDLCEAAAHEGIDVVEHRRNEESDPVRQRGQDVGVRQVVVQD